MNKVTVNGIDIAYERRGKGTPLMLVHGFPLDSSSWNEVIPSLEDKFDLILPDLRGLGQSTTIESQYTMSDMADDLAGLLDHLGVEKTAIAGHSMGGYVALAFAKKYPDRVSGLGLVSSQAAGDPPERKEGRYKTAADVTEKGVSVVVEAMTPKLSADARVQAFVRGAIEKQSQAGVSGALKAMAEREDLTSLIAAFNFPLVLIHGDADALVPIDRAKEIKAAVPSANFVELKGAGHMPMMEFAKETAAGLSSLSSS
ncbi:MAG: alpha/beta hydrolase [Anaerolineales bacterium]|nr:alpha/beta hydrolase [Anaerolineales bacterium]